MLYRMALAVVDASTFTIALVKAPFALMRGGASPVTLVRLISYRVSAVFR
jgi:hypothetical protein